MAGINTPQAEKKDDAMTSLGKAFSIYNSVQGMAGNGKGDDDKKARAEAMKRRSAALSQYSGVDTDASQRADQSTTA